MAEDPSEMSEEDLAAFEEEQEELAEGLRDAVLDYVEENDVPEPTAVWALLELAVSMHMSGYASTVEKPSVQGLKMELDRLTTDVTDLIREAKKGAGEFIENYKTMLEENDDEEEEDERK